MASKLYEYILDPEGVMTPLKQEIYLWKQKPVYDMGLYLPELEYGSVLPYPDAEVEKKPLLSREEMKELLESDVLPVFIMSHAGFPEKYDLYGIFGEPHKYSHVRGINDIQFTIPEDAIIVNLDINHMSMVCNLYIDSVIMKIYGTHPDLLVGTNSRHPLFDIKRYDNEEYRKLTMENRDILQNIFNHTQYYFEGDPFYNLNLAFGDDIGSRFKIEYFAKAPHAKPDFNKYLNHWGFYIPTEEYKYTRIPCEELLYPYINIDFSKPSRTFELIHTGEIVEHSYHDLKIHIVWDEEVYEKIYTLISETEKPFMERVGNAFEYEGEVDFETMCFDILEKGYGKHIYHVSFYKDGEKAYPSTIDEQDMDALIIFEVFMYKLLSEEDKAKVELREHSKLLLEFPLVFEFYGPRVLLDEAELSKIGVCSLKNVVEYMTPRLKRGDYGVPIKRKIAYFLISCRDNYVPPEIWGEQAEAVALTTTTDTTDRV
jgi:hypothetical protein